MSRQSEQDERWLGGYRRMVVCALLLVILATLALSYRSHRAEALAVSLSLLGEQFAERAQRLHGRWLDERRPAVLHAEGVAWQFDERGWPLAVLPLQSPSGNCRQLWLMLIGPDDPGLPSWQALASQDGGGCEFGWEGHWLRYRFSDGRVLAKP
ncbi:hypothetical protein KI797_18975 [Aeromonas media]|uniref:MSHA biogenesis protein MshF n=1 Tax=Aeromonas media TaxID=651 RepID=A0AAE6VPA8_AERME|nr:hypothetical protein [Aeromonas media]MBP8051436.1 hypothetical protein [Aeromonas sp.]MBP8270013.1 hypothetical protein [Aeromonas sp.]QHQ52875.1 hypothetical protein GWI30_19895 [Aeromonas media]UCP14630.1 hypothetical protein KI797_18975 [Aeromonas media]